MTKQVAEIYIVNPKVQYNPNPETAQGNSTSWGLVKACLANGPKTRKVLQDVLQDRNHTPFIGYCIRRKWLVEK